MNLILGILLILATTIISIVPMMRRSRDIRASAKTPTPAATTSAALTPSSTEVIVEDTPRGVIAIKTPPPTSTPLQTITATPKPTSPPPPPQGDLFSTMNAYRASNGRGTLAINATLCRIASTRASQQSQAGSLDNHAGFQGQAASQTEFHHLGEVLQYQPENMSPAYLVYTGWGTSGTHNAEILNPQWTHGCGATSGQFAVFIFASP